MNADLLAGLAVTFLPLAVIGFVMLRRQAGIFRMYLAMLAIGFGYLWATGGINEIGARILGHDVVTLPDDAGASAPAAEKATEPAAAPEEKKDAAPAADKATEPPPAPADPDVTPDKSSAPEETPPPPAPPQGAGAPAAP